MDYRDRAQLCARVESLRRAMFDLASDLRSHCLTDGKTDVSTALVEMQGVANRLGRVEAVLGSLARAE